MGKEKCKDGYPCLNSGEELCAYLETGKQLDILYLDIELFEVSGIDAGIFIRKQMENHNDADYLYIGETVVCTAVV
mgnify:CR=1 FL=1